MITQSNYHRLVLSLLTRRLIAYLIVLNYLNRIKEITRASNNGLVTGTTLGGVSDSWTYNGFGEVSGYNASYGSSTLLNVQYTRDALGRITQKTETTNSATDVYGYTYDLAGRLIDVSKNSANISHYDYDSNGNRASYNNSVIGTYNAQDRLISYGAYSFTYTANGDLASKTGANGTTQYGYDNFGNLAVVVQPDGTRIEYVVDGQNRRVGKKVNGTLVQGFLYENQLRPIAELDGNGNVVSQFVYGTKINVPDYMIKGENAYRIITDHLGSPRLIVDISSGSIVQQMSYDEFGNVTQDTNPGFQPFGFAGGLYDRDTGLVRFGARDYDPLTGKWTAKDPIRFKSGDMSPPSGYGSFGKPSATPSIDTNLYSYTLNDPVTYIDPLGLFTWKGWAGTIVFGVGVATWDPVLMVAGGALTIWDWYDSIQEANKKGKELAEQCKKLKKPEQDRIKQLMEQKP